jgi:hypothetical protein
VSLVHINGNNQTILSLYATLRRREAKRRRETKRRLLEARWRLLEAIPMVEAKLMREKPRLQMFRYEGIWIILVKRQ